jgi:hypothetical protein
LKKETNKITKRYAHREIEDIHIEKSTDILKIKKDMPHREIYAVLTFLQYDHSRRIKAIQIFFFSLELEHFPASEIVNHTSKEVTSNK